jgi:hypothetical protein
MPLNGTADFEFSLWDEGGSGNPPAGGNQIGSTVSVEGVGVTNGLFNVEPDFGVAAMMVERRWMQIAVRSPSWDGQGDEPPFTTLSPRQALTAAPYAVVSLEPGPRAGSAYTGAFLGGYAINDCYLGDVITCVEATAFTVSLPDTSMLEVDAIFDTAPTAKLEIQRLPRAGTAGPGFFDIHVNTVQGQDVNTFSVAPDRPIYHSWYDPNFVGDLLVGASLNTDSLVQFTICSFPDGRPSDVNVIRTEVNGDLLDVHVAPFAADARMAQLRATIRNDGEIPGAYIITVTDCPSHIAPVIAQNVYLDAGPEYATPLEFTLRTDAPLTGDEACVVSLLSSTGRRFREQIVNFPPPTEGARASAGKHSPEAKVNLGAAAPDGEDDHRRRASVDIIKTRNAEIADLKARLERLEELVAQLADTPKGGER